MTTSNPVSAQLVRPKPWLGGLLGFFFPGLGHLYVGRAAAGLSLLGACYGLSAMIIAWGWGRTAWGEILVLGSCLALVLVGVMQPVVVAWHQPEQVQLRYMCWPVYLVFAIASAVVQWTVPPTILSHTGGSIFSVPSQSMAPTLSRGDVIAVDQSAYVRQLPVPGDVVVVRVLLGAPAEPISYVRRVRSVIAGPAPNDARIEVAADNRDFDTPELKSLSAKEVTGKVTLILWSRDMARIGHRIQ